MLIYCYIGLFTYLLYLYYVGYCQIIVFVQFEVKFVEYAWKLKAFSDLYFLFHVLLI